MSRAAYFVNTEAMREKIVRWANEADLGFFVEFRRDKRSLEQNKLMWAALTDLSTQLQWHGQTLSTEDWKVVMMAGLDQEMRLVPNISGNGFVHLGRSSSKLTKSEMTELIELIHAFGAQHGVVFGDQQEDAA